MPPPHIKPTRNLARDNLRWDNLGWDNLAKWAPSQLCWVSVFGQDDGKSCQIILFSGVVFSPALRENLSWNIATNLPDIRSNQIYPCKEIQKTFKKPFCANTHWAMLSVNISSAQRSSVQKVHCTLKGHKSKITPRKKGEETWHMESKQAVGPSST